MEGKWKGPVSIGETFTAPDNDGELGFRRVRVIGRHPDDEKMLICQEQASRMKGRRVGEVFLCPELNLRIVFWPESDLEDDGARPAR